MNTKDFFIKKSIGIWHIHNILLLCITTLFRFYLNRLNFVLWNGKIKKYCQIKYSRHVFSSLTLFNSFSFYFNIHTIHDRHFHAFCYRTLFNFMCRCMKINGFSVKNVKIRQYDTFRERKKKYNNNTLTPYKNSYDNKNR